MNPSLPIVIIRKSTCDWVILTEILHGKNRIGRDLSALVFCIIVGEKHLPSLGTATSYIGTGAGSNQDSQL
jgi:hypothetical protein